MMMKLWILGFAVAFWPALTSAQDDGATQVPTNPPSVWNIYTSGIESGFVPNITEGSGPTVNQDRVVDFDFCYGALDRHDANGNQRIEEGEYLQFAQDFGRNTECLAQMDELPLELRVVWNQLSCECAFRGGDPDCCVGPNANIPITGVKPDAPTIVEEQQFLRQSCLRTDQAIITFCGPPPPLPIIGPPPGFASLIPGEGRPARVIAPIVALIVLFLLCRRRWCFFPAGKGDEDSSESESESDGSDDDSAAGGMRHIITEEEGDIEDPPPVAGVPDGEEGGEVEPAEDAMQLRAVENEEDGEFGGTSYGRTVQEPEWEDIEGNRKAGYEQYELPKEPEVPITLKPIPGKMKEEEEEPYDLEHYIPDGGIVEYEREGEWRYDADGGWTPEERAERDPVEFNREGYDRAEIVTPAPVDNRRDRHLEAYGAGEIFNQLDQDVSESAAAAVPDDMFDWVIRSTLNALDDKDDDLKASEHGSDS